MKRTLLAVIAVVGLAAGCSSSNGEAPAEASAPAGPAQAEFNAPVTITAPGNRTLGTVTFLQIEQDPKCATKYGKVMPASGTYVAVQMRVETTDTHNENEFMRTTSRDFSEITPAGITKSADNDEYNCIQDRDRFKNPFQPSSKYEGWVLLDVSDPTSNISYLPQYAPTGTAPVLLPTATTVEKADATTTRSSTTAKTSNWDPNSADPLGDAAEKEAERQAAANPDGSGKLAIEMTKLTGEKLTPADAQLMAGYLCAIIALTEMNNEEGYSDEDVVDETSREMGMSKEGAMRLLTLAVEYRCPDASIN